MKKVETAAQAATWSSAAAAYDAARQFVATDAARELGDFNIRPVMAAGAFLLRFEAAGPRPEILGYLGE